jgi:hypothetical protein
MFLTIDYDRVIPLQFPFFIKIAPENPVLWTGMNGASAESGKNKSDAETSLIFISPRFSMT